MAVVAAAVRRRRAAGRERGGLRGRRAPRGRRARRAQRRGDAPAARRRPRPHRVRDAAALLGRGRARRAGAHRAVGRRDGEHGGEARAPFAGSRVRYAWSFTAQARGGTMTGAVQVAAQRAGRACRSPGRGRSSRSRCPSPPARRRAPRPARRSTAAGRASSRVAGPAPPSCASLPEEARERPLGGRRALRPRPRAPLHQPDAVHRDRRRRPLRARRAVPGPLRGRRRALPRPLRRALRGRRRRGHAPAPGDDPQPARRARDPLRHASPPLVRGRRRRAARAAGRARRAAAGQRRRERPSRPRPTRSSVPTRSRAAGRWCSRATPASTSVRARRGSTARPSARRWTSTSSPPATSSSSRRARATATPTGTARGAQATARRCASGPTSRTVASRPLAGLRGRLPRLRPLHRLLHDLRARLRRERGSADAPAALRGALRGAPRGDPRQLRVRRRPVSIAHGAGGGGDLRSQWVSVAIAVAESFAGSVASGAGSFSGRKETPSRTARSRLTHCCPPRTRRQLRRRVLAPSPGVHRPSPDQRSTCADAASAISRCRPVAAAFQRAAVSAPGGPCARATARAGRRRARAPAVQPLELAREHRDDGHRPRGDDRGGAGARDQQPDLADHVARADRRDELVAAADLRLALLDHEEVVGELALGGERARPRGS